MVPNDLPERFVIAARIIERIVAQTWELNLGTMLLPAVGVYRLLGN